MPVSICLVSHLLNKAYECTSTSVEIRWNVVLGSINDPWRTKRQIYVTVVLFKILISILWKEDLGSYF